MATRVRLFAVFSPITLRCVRSVRRWTCSSQPRSGNDRGARAVAARSAPLETTPLHSQAPGDGGESLRDALGPFLSRLTMAGLAGTGAVSTWQPRARPLQVVALWIDLSGFTKLAE